MRKNHKYIYKEGTERMKKPPANSPSLWQAGAKTPWVVIDPRSTYGFWMYFSPSLLLLVPYVSPIQGGHCSLDSGLYGCVKQLSMPRVAHLGRPGEALGSWCFTTSVWTTLCNETVVHLLTYFPGHSRIPAAWGELLWGLHLHTPVGLIYSTVIPQTGAEALQGFWHVTGMAEMVTIP